MHVVLMWVARFPHCLVHCLNLQIFLLSTDAQLVHIVCCAALRPHCAAVLLFGVAGLRDVLMVFLVWRGAGGAEGSRPAYGCQVVVQSKQERLMMKMNRREEKRERKREKRVDDGGEYAEASFAFDPKEMRLQR